MCFPKSSLEIACISNVSEDTVRYLFERGQSLLWDSSFKEEDLPLLHIIITQMQVTKEVRTWRRVISSLGKRWRMYSAWEIKEHEWWCEGIKTFLFLGDISQNTKFAYFTGAVLLISKTRQHARSLHWLDTRSEQSEASLFRDLSSFFRKN